LRPNLSDEEFSSLFLKMGVEEDVSHWVRNEVDGYKYAEEILVHWDDEMWNFYRIDGEEIEFILERACEKFKIPLPDTKNPEIVPDLLAVKDVILYIDTLNKALLRRTPCL